MNNEKFQEYKPDAKFYNVDNDIYFEYNNNIVPANINSIQDFINELKYPCKIIFIGIPITFIVEILDLFVEDEIKSVCYREIDNKTNETIYNVVIIKNEKIKKL